jgi:hypothetical protein
MGRPAKTKPELRSIEPSASQVLANRIWDGQSPDLPVSERVNRIVNALKARGFDLDITLPDAERYINEAKAN